MNKRDEGCNATVGDIEIFNRPRELTRTKNLNRGWTRIYADKNKPQMDTNERE